mmetsp:Transcript_25924/g.59241  ORF Transcript_25924/g.59241 Transcript_25924/m.59241 type:complete len:148 (+) Transcript_25924:625-1068(+)
MTSSDETESGVEHHAADGLDEVTGPTHHLFPSSSKMIRPPPASCPPMDLSSIADARVTEGHPHELSPPEGECLWTNVRLLRSFLFFPLVREGEYEPNNDERASSFVDSDVDATPSSTAAVPASNGVVGGEYSLPLTGETCGPTKHSS